MRFPGEADLLAERASLLETLVTLSDEEFESGPTLCEEWAPRDVVAHLLGIDRALPEYARSWGNIRRANAAIVDHARAESRDELMDQARQWVASPPLTTRSAAVFLLGDSAVHHQDILRGLGRRREIPAASRAAILREGVVLAPHRLLRHRVVPDDGGWAIGRGEVVRGSSEALGLWLSGRRGVEAELTFVI
jgi:uncharacterized protein (TIGR03083 family)